ncbi:MAG: HAMP domain-containing protein, partial [Methanoregula sp.]|nr:HAMP domain-containing protein [Methanoregula sp.]
MQFIDNLPIGKKITGSFVITGIIFAIVALIGYSSMNSAGTAGSNAAVIVLVSIIGCIGAIGMGFILTKSIEGPVQQISKNISEIHKGHLSERIHLNRKDEIGALADEMDKFSEDLQKYVVGTMKMIAEGDLSRELKVRDDKDEIVPALKKTIDTLKNLIAESNKLSMAAVEGKLSVRGDAEKFKGGYWEIIAGINKTFDNVILPLNEGMRVSQVYSTGDFTIRFDEAIKVRGDFRNFKNSLNSIGIEVSKAMLAVNQQVSNLAANTEEANASVEEISAGSNLIAQNATAVSVNTEKSAQGIGQVQQAMDDLSRAIQEVATKSESVAQLATESTNYSREGMNLAQKTEGGMQGITKSSNDVNQIIMEIKGQMDQISEI